MLAKKVGIDVFRIAVEDDVVFLVLKPDHIFPDEETNRKENLVCNGIRMDSVLDIGVLEELPPMEKHVRVNVDLGN